MVSLGPLSQKRHCPYHCAFCYVQDDFSSYVKLDIDEIVEFLIKNRDKYNIIYVIHVLLTRKIIPKRKICFFHMNSLSAACLQFYIYYTSLKGVSQVIV